MLPRPLILSILCPIFLLPGCSGPDPEGYSSYATAYLGPNGEILFTNTPTSKRGRNGVVPARQFEWSWTGDGVSGDPSIVIDLSDQTATFYKGGVEVGRAPVSTGREGYHTPTGVFSVMQKSRNHVSNLYGDYVDANGEVVVRNIGINQDKRPPGTHFCGAPMPYFLRVTGSVGMHAGYLPGYPASHGCIRLPHEAAEVFFNNAPLGTPVRIVH